MPVHLPTSSAMKLPWVGSRCWTSTNAMPLVEGSALKNFVSASRPPADEPRPTIARSTGRAGSGAPPEGSWPASGPAGRARRADAPGFATVFCFEPRRGRAAARTRVLARSANRLIASRAARVAMAGSAERV